MNNLAISYAALGRYADARKLCEEALALYKARLGPVHPGTLRCMKNLALCYAALGRRADALKLHEETLALKKAKLGPDHPDTLLSMGNIADSLVRLGRGSEAIRIIDECLHLARGKVVDPQLIPGIVGLRLRRFVKAKDAAGCRTTAEMWERFERTDAASLYDAACMRAVTAAVLRATDKSAAGAKRADAEADKALDWLRKAVAAGYKNVAHMKKDTDLDPLRPRQDFQQLLARLEKAQPPAKSQPPAKQK
jgi:tetratricopeptide (TPR) repeat protein